MPHPSPRPTARAHDEAERTIAPPVSAEVDVAQAMAAADAAAPAAGYRFGKLIGQGGEGEIHEAVQLAFRRSVAIKTLRSAEPSQRLLYRFRAEAAITALLEHPNIIPVHDLRLGPDGRPQLVMKKIGGRTWRQLLDGDPPAPGRPPLTGEEHVDILLKVCDAMSFAHSRGILHRDLKPENIMVGEHGEVLVMDWGCAVHLGPQAPHPDIPLLGQLSGVSGTPVYLSPEQARADFAACGPWSDVFLLGGVLYRMLTGSPPWLAESAIATVRLAAKGEPPPAPSVRAGRKVPGELSRICMQALHPDPAARLRSVDELAAAVRRYVEHREVHRLISEARRQYDLAKSGGSESDDSYRRAINAVEQALQLWPEQVAARRLFVEVGLDSARQAIAAGAFRVAKRQAAAASHEAERLGDATGIEAAGRLVALADSSEREHRRREASLKTMRQLAIAGSAVAGLALLVGLLAAWRQSTRTAYALAEARTNLERFESERAARVDGERLAAPALVAQARELALGRQFEEALPLVKAAMGFAPQDPQPPTTAAQILIALGRRSEAVKLLDRAIALRPDADASELRRLCTDPPNDAEARIAAVLVRMGASGAAGALNVAAEQRAVLARAQLAKAWQRLPDSAVSALANGTLAISVRFETCELESLEPLRGLPVSSLDIGGQRRLHDLAPLQGLPLTSLGVWNLPVQDLTPLKGLPLKRLSISGTPLTDLSIISDMPLEVLYLTATGLTSLEVFAAMPLHELRLSNCDQLADLSALRGMPLEVLYAEAARSGSSRITSLMPLKGLPLRELSLAWQRGMVDLEPLTGAPLNKVVLSGTAVTNLGPIASPSLRNLQIDETPVPDLRPILHCPLETIELSPQGILAGLDELLRLPSLRTVNKLPRDDYAGWLALQRAIVAANPDYAWNAQARVFAGGKPGELACEAGIRDLSPLKGLRLRTLRVVRGTFTDLSALAGMPLEELELPGCAINDLAPIARIHSLRRLNIAGCPLTTLAPLERLHLDSIVFTPGNRLAGIDVLRSMRSLKRLGTTAGQMLETMDFWRAFDRGDLK